MGGVDSRRGPDNPLEGSFMLKDGTDELGLRKDEKGPLTSSRRNSGAVRMMKVTHLSKQAQDMSEARVRS